MQFMIGLGLHSFEHWKITCIGPIALFVDTPVAIAGVVIPYKDNVIRGLCPHRLLWHRGALDVCQNSLVAHFDSFQVLANFTIEIEHGCLCQRTVPLYIVRISCYKITCRHPKTKHIIAVILNWHLFCFNIGLTIDRENTIGASNNNITID